MLIIDNLSFRIGGRLILDGANAAISDGRKVGLIGRNGAGKTTLLKLILGEGEYETGHYETGHIEYSKTWRWARSHRRLPADP